MTLLITVFAAVTATIVWYQYANSNKKLGMLALMYWGAALMWFVDAVAEYIEVGAAYFTPAPAELLSDAYLGLSVAVLGLVIWLARLLVKDPDGTLRAALAKKK